MNEALRLPPAWGSAWLIAPVVCAAATLAWTGTSGLGVTEVVLTAAVPLAVLAVMAGVLAGATWTALVLLFTGAVLTDFAPFALFRYLLLGDVLIIAAYVVFVSSTYWRIRLPMDVLAVFGLYVAAMFVSLLWSDRALVGLLSWLHICFLVFVLIPCAHTYMVNVPEARHAVPPALFVTGCLQAAYIVFAVFVGGLEWRGPRMPGAFGSAALFFFAASWLAGLVLITRTHGLRRLAVAAGLVVISVTLGLLRARSVWLGSLTGMLVLWFVRSGSPFRAGLRAVGVAALLVVAYTQGWLPQPIAERIDDSLRPNAAIDLVYRQDIVWALLPYVRDSPLIGVGMNQSQYLLPAHLAASGFGAIHNVVLNAMVEGGVLAGLALSMLPLLAWRLWRLGHARRSVADRDVADWAFACLAMLTVVLHLTPTPYEHVLYLVVAVASSVAYAAPDERRT